MRPVVLALAIALTCSCGPMPRPRWACEQAPRLYPSPNGWIPVCPWWSPRFSSCFFEDVNHDGQSNLADLETWCREYRDGDGLTMDRTEPREDAGWCYTCD